MGLFGKSKQEKMQEQMNERIDIFFNLLQAQYISEVATKIAAKKSKAKQKKLGMIWSLYLDYALFSLLSDLNSRDNFQHEAIEKLIDSGNQILLDMHVTLENYNKAKLAVSNRSDFAFEVIETVQDAFDSAINGDIKPFALELLNSKSTF